jgi:hypothetical protein
MNLHGAWFHSLQGERVDECSLFFLSLQNALHKDSFDAS